ncbi:extracellular solute-binding protein [Alsobacter sp. SYSU M60028]|uniref:Extracellular solute-binding protein n=1 Tax=Alsobacter ponti TaxID=2962936 RepID=A0ABT1L9E5_9HYPH|nr:extracellular solute-binding protein [Alsobacter ponti]MCP8938117.1 extracellular solute-binding protein [Alsobacter ponti]
MRWSAKGPRALVVAAVALAALWVAAPAARAADPEWRIGLSLMGAPKYQDGFTHFDYVRPDAPKGGTVRLGRQGAFDNFNLVVAGVKGQIEGGVGLVYEQLTEQALDEVSTAYGLLAEAMRHPDDFSSVTYRLRAEARWQDGKPVTPEDVIFSFDAFKANSPQYAFYWQHVVKAEKTGEREVTFRFDQPGNRELPQIVGQLTVLPKHWWEGTGPDGRKRDITQTTLEPPLGSGPYRLKAFDAQRNAVYERVKDYWGEKLPVRVGTNNFDEIRFEYYRDSTVLFEALKGDQYDFRIENSAKNWATGYDFPAAKDGRVLREEFAERASGRMQAFAFNLRRPKFQDARVRRAFNLAFDFEELNKQLFYGQYQRIKSYFEGTELASSGLPEGKEREILESVRDKVPPEVFTTPHATPVNGGPQAVRDNLREADRLLKEAGWEIKGGKRVNAKGEQLAAEFLAYDPTTERYVLFYKPALEKLGIGVSLRVVDPSQYENRMRDFDFDITTELWGQSLSPGNEQRDLWGSASANRPGSRNTLGVRDPGVDALIDKVIFARDREELVAATKALDRVLLAHDYVVPQWTYPFTRTARWNRFGRPETMPKYAAPAFPTIWWWDAELAKKTGSGR